MHINDDHLIFMEKHCLSFFFFLITFVLCIKQGDSCEDVMPVHMELLHSFHSLISSVEQLQSSFLFNPDKYSEGELATPPRRILNTLRYYWNIHSFINLGHVIVIL